jgi:hypothetical protein
MSTSSRVIGPESALVRALTRAMVRLGRYNFKPAFDWACDLENVPKSHKRDTFILAAECLMEQLQAENSCLPPETKVLMSDGSEKAVSQICDEDKVATDIGEVIVEPSEPDFKVIELPAVVMQVTPGVADSDFDFDVDHLTLTRLDAKAIPATMPRGSGSAAEVVPPVQPPPPVVVPEPSPKPTEEVEALTDEEKDAEALMKSLNFTDKPRKVDYLKVLEGFDSDPVVEQPEQPIVEQAEIPIGAHPVQAAAEVTQAAAKEAPEKEEDPFGIGREIEALVRARLAKYAWAIKPFWFTAEVDGELVFVTGLWTIKGVSEPSLLWTLYGKAVGETMIHRLDRAFEPDFKAIEWPLRMKVTYSKSAFVNTVQDVKVTCRVWAVRYVPGMEMKFWIHEANTAHKSGEDIWSCTFGVSPPKLLA